MKLIHNLSDDFISARQPQEGPSTQTVAEYVIREDMVDGHHFFNVAKMQLPIEVPFYGMLFQKILRNVNRSMVLNNVSNYR